MGQGRAAGEGEGGVTTMLHLSTLKTLQREMWSCYTTHQVSGNWRYAVHPQMFHRWCELLDKLVNANDPEAQGKDMST